VNLPSFLWLWKIAAWSMGFSLVAYTGLALTGFWMSYTRRTQTPRPLWWRTVHFCLGMTLATLVIGLLAIGIVGTLGHYGTLGHSIHGVIGLAVVSLTVFSAFVAMQIKGDNPQARTLHIRLNLALGAALLFVLGTGWVVVQKYLP
jgi:ABC-type tungstate transport system substrate-binding protein